MGRTCKLQIGRLELIYEPWNCKTDMVTSIPLSISTGLNLNSISFCQFEGNCFHYRRCAIRHFLQPEAGVTRLRATVGGLGIVLPLPSSTWMVSSRCWQGVGCPDPVLLPFGQVAVVGRDTDCFVLPPRVTASAALFAPLPSSPLNRQPSTLADPWPPPRP